MKSSLYLASLLAMPWAMQPDVLQAYARVLASNLSAKGAREIQVSPNDVRVSFGGDEKEREVLAAQRAQARPQASRGIAVLGLYGPISQRANMMQDICGGTSCQQFVQSFRSALEDDTVAQILIDIDSPGGSVAGISELGSEIRAARGSKPVVGVANATCASAAYWLGSQCSELYCTPSGQVGSIGVITAHEDMSKAMEAEGINVTLLTYGQFKAEGNQYSPLDEEATRAIQSMLDSYGNDFESAVAKGRGVPVDTVRSSFGKGRMLRASEAKAAGMIDDVRSFDDVVKGMQRTSTPKRSALAAARQDLGLIG